MLVRKTKGGKLSLTMSHAERDMLFGAICNFLEDESGEILLVKTIKEADLMRKLYFYVLNGIMIQHDFKLQYYAPAKLQLTLPQSLAILWLLRDYDHEMMLLEMKSSLHKLLN